MCSRTQYKHNVHAAAQCVEVSWTSAFLLPRALTDVLFLLFVPSALRGVQHVTICTFQFCKKAGTCPLVLGPKNWDGLGSAGGGLPSSCVSSSQEKMPRSREMYTARSNEAIARLHKLAFSRMSGAAAAISSAPASRTARRDRQIWYFTSALALGAARDTRPQPSELKSPAHVLERDAQLFRLLQSPSSTRML